MRKILILVTFLLASLTMAPWQAKACGDCEYREGITGVCLPKSGCIIPKPDVIIKQTLSVIEAIASGDPKKVEQAVGDALVNSTGCLGCSYAAQKILPNVPKETINQAVGRGFFVFLGTGDPLLVFVAVADALQHPVATKRSPVPLPPPPAERGTITFTSAVACIVQRQNEVHAGLLANTAMKNEKTGQTGSFPDVDLQIGDIVDLTAPYCPSWNDPSQGAESKTSARMIYTGSTTIPGEGPNRIRYVLSGSVPK